MQTAVKSIRTDNIDNGDERYRISNPSGVDALQRSIESIGLINSPVLEPTAQGYRIVCGFKRIIACRALELREIQCRVIQDNPNELDCLKIAIADNAMARGLNTLEEARAVVKLWRACGPEENLPGLAAPLGVFINMALVDKYRQLFELPERVQTLVGEGVISLKPALELGRMDGKSAIAMANLFDLLRPTFGQQRELISSVRAISAVMDADIPELLEMPPISGILGDDDLDRKQKIRMVRHEIRKLRFPYMTRFEAFFNHNMKALSLEEGLALIPPSDFESPVYQFMIDFKSIEELQRKTDHIRKAAQSKALMNIMKREIEDIQDIY
jgi:hypothetical protein